MGTENKTRGIIRVWKCPIPPENRHIQLVGQKNQLVKNFCGTLNFFNRFHKNRQQLVVNRPLARQASAGMLPPEQLFQDFNHGRSDLFQRCGFSPNETNIKCCLSTKVKRWSLHFNSNVNLWLSEFLHMLTSDIRLDSSNFGKGIGMCVVMAASFSKRIKHSVWSSGVPASWVCSDLQHRTFT